MLKYSIEKVEELRNNLLRAFIWKNAEQGVDYWIEVYNNIEKLLEDRKKELAQLSDER